MKTKNVSLSVPVNMIEKTSKDHTQFIETLGKVIDYLSRYKGYVESVTIDSMLRIPTHKLKELDGWVKGFLKRASEIDRESMQLEKSFLDIVHWFQQHQPAKSNKINNTKK